MPSYATLTRVMRSLGLERRRRRRRFEKEPERPAVEAREVLSYEVSRSHALWHADYHHGRRRVLTASGEWRTPILLGFLDDHSRLGCHLQWYLAETAEVFVHGITQAFMKRGLPRSLLTDNGAPMMAGEVQEGLHRLGIVHSTTLAYSPYQNGKQEVLWASVEGRLMAMLEGVEPLTLDKLNDATVAWVEREYHRRVHRELGTTPLKRLVESDDASRPCPDGGALSSSPWALREAMSSASANWLAGVLRTFSGASARQLSGISRMSGSGGGAVWFMRVSMDEGTGTRKATLSGPPAPRPVPLPPQPPGDVRANIG